MKTTKGAITPSYCHNKNTIFMHNYVGRKTFLQEKRQPDLFSFELREQDKSKHQNLVFGFPFLIIG